MRGQCQGQGSGCSCWLIECKLTCRQIAGLKDNGCLLLMILPRGRELLALLETCQLQRWWKWLITAKDGLIVDGEAVLWLVPNRKVHTVAYWCLSFPHMMDFSSISCAAGTPVCCGGRPLWWSVIDFFLDLSTIRGNIVTESCHDWGWHQPSVASSMGLKRNQPNNWV